MKTLLRRFLFLFLFLAALPALSHAAACIDSDGGGGGEEFVLGACSSDYDYLVDNCAAAPKTLDEHSCSGNLCVTRSVSCANGCLLGACRSQRPSAAMSCSSLFDEQSTQNPYDFISIPAVEGQALTPTFGETSIKFQLKNWSEDRLIINDSTGVPILLEKWDEFSYPLFRSQGFQDGDRLGINYTGLLGEGANQKVQVNFTLYSADSSQVCLVLWSPRNYTYPLSEARAEEFLQFEVKAGKPSSEELSCAWSSNSGKPVQVPGVKLNEPVTATLDPAPSIGTDFVSVACRFAKAKLSIIEYYSVLPDSLESVYMTQPTNTSIVPPVGYAFELYGLEGFGYYCDGQINGAWFPIKTKGGQSESSGLSELASGAYSGEYAGLVNGNAYYARFRCNRSTGSDYFYSNGVYFTVEGDASAPLILLPINGSLHWSAAVNLTYVVPIGSADCRAYFDNSTPTILPGGAGWHSVNSAALPAGWHSVKVSCNNSRGVWANSTAIAFQTAEADRPLIMSPEQGKTYSYSVNISQGVFLPLTFVVNGSYAQYACSYSLGGNAVQMGNVTAGQQKTAYLNLTMGSYAVNVSCLAAVEKSAVVSFAVNLSGTPFVLQPNLNSPFYGRNYTVSTIDLDFKVEGTFQRYACYEKMDAAANWTFVINANNSERVLWGKRYANQSNGAHSLAFKCAGLLLQNNESQYQANVTIPFRVATNASLGPATVAAGWPPLPTVIPPMPSPRPQQAANRLELSYPSFASQSSTSFTGVLYVGGAPRCDPNTRVSVTVDGAAGKGAFSLCSPSSGEHQYTIETSKAGNYTVKIEALSYGVNASCSFVRRSGGSGEGDEVPDVPVLLALAAALFAFAAFKRKQ